MTFQPGRLAAAQPGASAFHSGGRASGVGSQPGLYQPQLDGLRAVAIILVLLFHAEPFGPFSGGFVGVDIFFVLSAYLITGTLAREWNEKGSIRLGLFYLKRALRLFPALLLMLAVYVVAAPFIFPGTQPARDALLAAFYLTDYSYPFFQAPEYLRHTWSLSVEEHFYLLWPLLLPLLIRSHRPLFWLGLAWIAGTLWRFGTDDWLHAYYRFDTHFTGLILGAALYFCQPKLALNSVHAAAAGLVLAALAISADIRQPWITIPVAEIAAFFLVGALVTGRAGAIGVALQAGPMVAIGQLSYAIYLWHSPLAYYIRDDWSFGATFASITIFAVAMAAISWLTVEALGREAKNRLQHV